MADRAPGAAMAPVFDGATYTRSWGGVVTLEAATHVVLEGLEVADCTAPSCEGIAADVAVEDLTIRGCHIHDVVGSGARFTGHAIRLEGNHVHDVALSNVDNAAYPDGGWPTCFGTKPDWSSPDAPHATDVTIRDNVIEDCWGEGIGAWFAADAVVEGNVIDNPFNVGIYLDNAHDVTVTRNFVHVSRGMHGGSGSGILMGTESYTSGGLAPSSTHDVAITNNVVVAGGGGIGWWSSDEPSAANAYASLLVAHNTVIVGHGGLSFDAVNGGMPAPAGCVAIDNVFVEATEAYLGDPAGWTMTSNAWVNEPVPGVGGASDVSVAATVPDVAAAADVQPLAAVVGAGVPAGVDVDYACAARDAVAPSRGAFER